MSDNLPTPQDDPLLRPGDPRLAWIKFVERAMQDPTFDVAKLATLLEERRKERAHEDRRAFNRALSAFQANVEPIVRDAINSHLKNKYATLQKTVEGTRPYMRAEGLNVRYVSAETQPGWVKLGIVLGHDNGWEDPPIYLEMPVGSIGSRGGQMAQTGPQAVGSVVTYLRRYLYTLALNLVLADDDDGESARHTRVPDTRPQSGNGKPPDPREDTDTQLWLSKLGQALAVMHTQAQVDEASQGRRVTEARANAPQWVRDEIDGMFAEAYARTLEGEAS